MKRSEMLEVMDKAVAQWHLHYVGNPDGYTCNMHVLKKMEEAGMLPPEKLLGLKEVEALRQWSISDQITSFHSWEKE